MDEFNELTVDEKQQLLQAARIRFGPELKIPRQRATEAIIERAIFLCNEQSKSEITSVNLRDFISKSAKIDINLKDISSTLDQLVQTQRIVVKHTTGYEDTYILSNQVADEFRSEIVHSANLLNSVIKRLFDNIISASVTPKHLTKYFLDFLASLFAKLGQQWVSQRMKFLPPDELIRNEEFNNIIREAINKSKLPKAIHGVLKSKCYDFFRINDPEYDQLKFNVGQSYYIAKLLGYGSNIDFLSGGAYAGSEIWIDTNVVVVALLQGSKHYKTFETIRCICKRIGISLRISRKTLLETITIVQREMKKVSKLYSEIPEEYLINKRSRNYFFETYKILRERNSETDSLEKLFSSFDNLDDKLPKLDIEVIDAGEELMNAILNDEPLKYSIQDCSLKIRGKKKSEDAILHDGYHHLLVKQDRKYGKQVWFLTLDTSLPAIGGSSKEQNLIPTSMTLDSFLQGITPFIDNSKEMDFASTFSSMVASQILPQNEIFDVSDFLIFSEVGISSKELSVEEIDECLHRVKKEILNGLNPYNINERKKQELEYWFKRFFSEHSLKKDGIIDLKEREIENLNSQLSKEHEQREKENSEAKKQITGLNENITRLSGEIDKINNDITQKEKERTEQEQAKEIEKKRIRTRRKNLAVGAIILIIFQLIAFYGAKYSIENWNGYIFYVKDGTPYLYLTCFVIALGIIFLLLGKQAFRDIKELLNEFIRK